MHGRKPVSTAPRGLGTSELFADLAFGAGQKNGEAQGGRVQEGTCTDEGN